MYVSYLFFLLFLFLQNCPLWINQSILFKRCFLYHSEVISFPKLVLELIKIWSLDLIFWNSNMHQRGWVFIWIFTSFRNIFVTFVARIIFTCINGYSIRYITLIKILSILNIFHIAERSWFPITIIALIELILYFC